MEDLAYYIMKSLYTKPLAILLLCFILSNQTFGQDAPGGGGEQW